MLHSDQERTPTHMEYGMVGGRPRGTHRLRRDAHGLTLLELEMARRGLTTLQLQQRGIGRMTLQRLKRGTADHRGETTSLHTAYRIARAIDPDHADELVETLFEPVGQDALR